MKRVKEKLSVAMSILGSFTLFPAMSQQLASRELKKNFEKVSSQSDSINVRNDWEQIGKDMRSAIDKCKLKYDAV